MKICHLLELISVAAAIQNPDGNTCATHRSCWTATDIKYESREIPFCTVDADCNQNHACIKHMW